MLHCALAVKLKPQCTARPARGTSAYRPGVDCAPADCAEGRMQHIAPFPHLLGQTRPALAIVCGHLVTSASEWRTPATQPSTIHCATNASLYRTTGRSYGRTGTTCGRPALSAISTGGSWGRLACLRRHAHRTAYSHGRLAKVNRSAKASTAGRHGRMGQLMRRAGT